VNRPTALGV